MLHLSSAESLDSTSTGFKQLLGETQHLLLDLIVRSLGIGLLEHREAEHVPGNHSFFQSKVVLIKNHEEVSHHLFDLDSAFCFVKRAF